MATRQYTTRRQGIVDALVTKLKQIDGSGAYHIDLSEQVELPFDTPKDLIETLSHEYHFLTLLCAAVAICDDLHAF